MLGRREVGPGEVLNIIIPESVNRRGLGYIIRERRLQRLKALLRAEPEVVVTNLACHEGYEALEPGEDARRGRPAGSGPRWRHVAAVLVSGAHNGTIGGLRYARSLAADELHCVHVETDPHETERLLESWARAVPRTPLEVLPSPYRQITTPVFVEAHLPVRALRRRVGRPLPSQAAGGTRARRAGCGGGPPRVAAGGPRVAAGRPRSSSPAT
jgi:hypothetical protein